MAVWVCELCILLLLSLYHSTYILPDDFVSIKLKVYIYMVIMVTTIYIYIYIYIYSIKVYIQKYIKIYI